MQFTVERSALLRPLQIVSGVVERRQTLPILGHILLELDQDRLTLTGTDLEVELTVQLPVQASQAGSITVPARKLFDLVRALPEAASIQFQVEQDRALVKSGRSRFTLATLPADDFPRVEQFPAEAELTLAQTDFRELLQRTHFSMALQDVRYYLNGLLLELEGDQVRCVATDGHRLALCERASGTTVSEKRQVILPRKAIQELLRLLNEDSEALQLRLGTNHARVQMGSLVFTTKLIDGRYPEYDRVIPRGGDKFVTVRNELLREALARASILSNEKYRGVRLLLESGLAKVHAHNPEQEEAEEEVEVQYSGERLEIGFNSVYLQEALAAVQQAEVQLQFSDANSSCLIETQDSETGAACRYVVMPMRL